MYPPQNAYSRLPTDPETAADGSSIGLKPRPWESIRVSSRLVSRVRLLSLLIAGTFISFLVFVSLQNDGDSEPSSPFVFEEAPRPAWLDKAPDRPLRLRVAVVSRPHEFDMRMGLREVLFRGVREEDAVVDYRFFVGRPTGEAAGSTIARLREEMASHSDIGFLENIDDIGERLSEKRWGAVKWGGSVPHDTYDWFMTIDSDTFVRFGALARRLPTLLSGLDKTIVPQNQSALIGKMGSHLMYFVNTVPDGNTNPKDEDLVLKGPWYDYPIGIGYMLSPFLVNKLVSMDPSPPHHVPYPGDDVMIGAWIAALKHYPDTSIHFETTPEHSPLPIKKVVPEPWYPEPIETEIVNDKVGWHDYGENHTQWDSPVTWDSVCVHHVSVSRMREFRESKWLRDEWA